MAFYKYVNSHHDTLIYHAIWCSSIIITYVLQRQLNGPFFVYVDVSMIALHLVWRIMRKGGGVRVRLQIDT